MYVCKGAGGGCLKKKFFGPSDLSLVLKSGGRPSGLIPGIRQWCGQR